MIKKILPIILIMCFTLSLCVNAEKSEKSNEDAGKGLSASSPHVILIDVNSGSVLYKKQADKQVYPASLTEIMTAVLALEGGNLEEVLTVSDSALANVKEGASNMGLKKGEQLSLRQLLYGILLASYSDAANVVAEHIAGSTEAFVEMMNDKALELKMKDTNFVNPSGEHEERHYTTANDMAKLVMYAMKIDEFKAIVKSESYVIPATEKYPEERSIVNGNHLLSRLRRSDYYYKYATGIKTGYTAKAKSCIAASAVKNGVELLALVFEADNVDGKAMSFVDCAQMFDYVFENYTKKTVIGADEVVAQAKIKNARRTEKIILETENAVTVLRKKNEETPEVTYKDSIKKEICAPVKKGEKFGEREYFIDGKTVGKVSLIADKNYKFDMAAFTVNKMIDFFKSPWFAVCIILMIILFIVYERRRRRILRQKRRTERKRRNAKLLMEIENMK